LREEIKNILGFLLGSKGVPTSKDGRRGDAQCG